MQRSSFSHVLLSSLLLAIALVCGLGTKVAGSETAKPKDASTPEEAVKYLCEAAAAGNWEDFSYQFDEPYCGFMRAAGNFCRAEKDLHDALDEKFGKDPKERAKTIGQNDLAKAIERYHGAVKIISKEPGDEGSVALKLSITRKGKDGKATVEEAKFTAIKKESGWKLVPWEYWIGGIVIRDGKLEVSGTKYFFVEPYPPWVKVQQSVLEKESLAAIKVANEIKEGKYPTRAKAQAAIHGDQEAAVAHIKKLGGTIEVAEGRLGSPVVNVDLSDTKTSDADLEGLKGLTQLQELVLRGTQVTDAGLKHLEGFHHLSMLHVNTKVTKQGIATLQRAMPHVGAAGEFKTVAPSLPKK